jgi:hypothetical protein
MAENVNDQEYQDSDGECVKETLLPQTYALQHSNWQTEENRQTRDRAKNEKLNVV